MRAVASAQFAPLTHTQMHHRIATNRTTLARKRLHTWLVNLCHDSAHKFQRNFPINYWGFSLSPCSLFLVSVFSFFFLVSRDVNDFVFFSFHFFNFFAATSLRNGTFFLGFPRSCFSVFPDFFFSTRHLREWSQRSPWHLSRKNTFWHALTRRKH